MAARINGKHKCGHPTRYFSESQSARSIITALADEDCVKCQRWADAQEAIRIAQELGLPDLEGSDKQVSWARDIRERLRVALSDWIDRNASPESLACTEAIMLIRDAGWWIDRKDDGPEGAVAWVRPLVTVGMQYASDVR